MIPLIQGVSITPITPVNVDERGLTYEFWRDVLGRQVTYCERKQGVVVGNHFHQGKDPSKDPERLMLLSGALKMLVSNGRQTLKTNLSREAENRCYEITIHPGIVHAFLPCTPIQFLEYRSTIFNPQQSDTYPTDAFEAYLREQGMSIDREALSLYRSNIRGFIL